MMHTLPVVMRLAWRNLWRNYRRTLIMIAAVAVGVWAMMFMTALMRGMVNDMIREAVRTLPGHVQIHHPDYGDDPNVVNSIPAPGDELQAVFRAGARAWAARVRVPAVISSERESRSVTFVGVDPGQRRGFRSWRTASVPGDIWKIPQTAALSSARSSLPTLETGLGKRIVIMTQDPDNEIADRGFRVVGIYSAKTDAVEEALFLPASRRRSNCCGSATTCMRLRSVAQISAVSRRCGNSVAAVAGPSERVQAWYELDSYLGTMLKVMDGFVLVWIVVIFLALSFGLVNTLVMAVFERVREIGLMLALGMKPFMILAQILIESLLLLLIGLAVGNLLAWLSIVPLRDGIDVSIVAEGMEMFGASSVLYPELILDDVVLANVIVILLGLVASLSPAWRASRYQPIEAISKA